MAASSWDTKGNEHLKPLCTTLKWYTHKHTLPYRNRELAMGGVEGVGGHWMGFRVWEIMWFICYGARFLTISTETLNEGMSFGEWCSTNAQRLEESMPGCNEVVLGIYGGTSSLWGTSCFCFFYYNLSPICKMIVIMITIDLHILILPRGCLYEVPGYSLSQSTLVMSSQRATP